MPTPRSLEARHAYLQRLLAEVRQTGEPAAREARRNRLARVVSGHLREHLRRQRGEAAGMRMALAELGCVRGREDDAALRRLDAALQSLRAGAGAPA